MNKMWQGQPIELAIEIHPSRNNSNKEVCLPFEEYESKVKSSRHSLRETRDKRPLGRDSDRSWCHRHTNVKLT